MKKRLIALSFLALFVSSQANAAEMKLKEIDLPEDTGREEVEVYCGACHSLRLVAQQRMTRTSWQELLVWMVEEHEMEELPKEDEKLVLDYLEKYRGVKEAAKKAAK